MSKDDRNVAIIVAIVLVVCTISLVLVVNFAWQLLKPNLELLITLFGIREQPIIAINYNFPIPQITPEDIAGSVNYNFEVIAGPEREYDRELVGQTDVLVGELAALTSVSAARLPEQIIYNIQIPRLSASTAVYTSNTPAQSLAKGFWALPGSDGSLNGKMLFFCQRTYFAPGDPRSCWYLDDLQIGDELFLTNLDSVQKYRVTFVDSFSSGDPAVFSLPEYSQGLKIVTSSATGGRIVVNAIAVQESVD